MIVKALPEELAVGRMLFPEGLAVFSPFYSSHNHILIF
jgi:hypothetical protein